MPKKLTPKNLLIISASTIGACLLLAVLGSCLPDPPLPEPTQQPNRNQIIDIEQTPTEIITQLTNTLLPTNTLRPTNTKTTIPTKPSITNTPPKRIIATATKQTLKPTATRIIKKPTATSKPSGACVCSRDYDCKDFATHNAAQSCFKSCGGSTTKNWSNLDSDGDGIACESLP